MYLNINVLFKSKYKDYLSCLNYKEVFDQDVNIDTDMQRPRVCGQGQILT